MHPSRRSLLVGATALAAASAVIPRGAPAANGQEILRLQTRQIEVGGKAATRYGVAQPSGAVGLTLDEGDTFDVRVENTLKVTSGLHWHGLNPPWQQDGVPYISGPPIAAGQSAAYKFPAAPVGTRWMHSHFGLQEQNLLAAPLIVRETEAIRSGRQEVVVLFEDFSWTKPEALLEKLRQPMAGGRTMGGMKMSKPDYNDIDYEAYLANDRSLADPQVVDVERAGEVRLRLINGSASSNFTIDLGAHEGTLLTVDGNPVEPLKASLFPLAVAQRADILVRLPGDGQAVPVLARGEGRALQAGIVMRPPGAAVAKISVEGDVPGPAVGLKQEELLRALRPLPARRVDRSVPVGLTGTMTSYTWSMPVHGMIGAPVTIARGERVELVMENKTMMAHPMHLHGHSFQVTEINDRKLAGAVRDSILVPPHATVKVVFDADNPGIWAYHCHNLYHMAAGMFTTVVYRGFT
ncbi:multicopper oxidase family protein [Reyranella sp.]|uniref:multicopper oxidase family protein n=1 Tax=Reyranella sp. TaxID=1929291 RepID=UPI00272FA1BE|nr:multicopper oxidase family protein [Reyranella sp.]MDP2374850.1 multicopper oxidase family protein [Reyranella sp.]